MDNQNLHKPVFIGGTGRCGTSIMAKLLASDRRFDQPCNENKLIVENDGLIDVLHAYTIGDDWLRRHFAMARFYSRSHTLRFRQGRNADAVNEVNELIRGGMHPHKAAQIISAKYPDGKFNLHAIGQQFGLDHFDKSIAGFLASMVSSIDRDGVTDTDGLLKPLFVGRPLSREECLSNFRKFLLNLYSICGDKRWIDDTPSNSSYISFLFELFPEAKFIHMVRDPTDVADSMLGQVWNPNRDMMSTLLSIQRHHRAVEKNENSLAAANTLTIRLEDLVEDMSGVVDKLSAFLQIELNVNTTLVDAGASNIGRADDLTDELLLKEELAYLRNWSQRYGYL